MNCGTEAIYTSMLPYTPHTYYYIFLVFSKFKIKPCLEGCPPHPDQKTLKCLGVYFIFKSTLKSHLREQIFKKIYNAIDII